MSSQGPVVGFMYFVKGFCFLFRRGVRRFIIIPVMINCLLYSVLLVTGISLIGYLGNLLPHWLHWLIWLFWIVFFLGSAVIVIYTFTLLANLVGAPFNSLLSEKIEWMVSNRKLSSSSIKQILKDIRRVLRREWLKIKYYLPRAFLLLVLFLVPGINIVASVCWFLFGCWMMALQYVDYPFDNHRTTFDEMQAFLKANAGVCLGFGSAVILVSLIPVINFFVMPAAVIGGTLMFLDLGSVSLMKVRIVC